MARRIRARGVLRLRSVNGLSRNAIARSPTPFSQNACSAVCFYVPY